MIGIFLTFIILIGLTVADKTRFAVIRQKCFEDWVLDGAGLVFQGVVIPILQIEVVYQLYQYLLPSDRAALNLPPLVAFLLSFVVVDYLYYWNHRWLHSRWLWRVHLVHHTVTEMHVLGTSRNTLWTSFLILYLWVHGLFIYLLQDPSWYILGVTLTCALDLWRHSEINPRQDVCLYRWLSPWLILPTDHAWHHARDFQPCNYGANLKFWDKMHGTYYQGDKLPDSLGVKTNLTLIQKLICPF